MNKTAIKNFAVWARQKLIDDITYKMRMLGITENGIAEKLSQSTEDMYIFNIGTKDYAEVSGKEIKQRDALINVIKAKERDTQDYKEAYEFIIEEVAYTWFNRLIAIRFMEVNDYLPSRVRVLSSENKAKIEPDFVTNPFDTDLEFTPYEQDRVIQLKDENKLDELFRMLFIKQCNKLNEILPELFEKTDDFSELLLTISFTDKDGIVYKLTHDIDEDDFNVEKEGQVEIIGWMYQYYNIEPKATVFARAKGTKIKKEQVPAATQLFTPDWIVRYMIENSLGRLWYEGHTDSNIKENWKYYLDEAEQEPEVQAKLNVIREEYKTIKPEDIKLIDPCMGSGHILVYAFDVLMQIYESYGYTARDAASLIVENNIFGLDVDKRAAQLSYFAVMMKGRQYDRRFLTRGLIPHIYDIPEIKKVKSDTFNALGDCADIARRVCDSFIDGKEYGSLITPNLSFEEIEKLNNKLEKMALEEKDILSQIAMNTVTPFMDIVKILVQKYDVVVTNPPYMAVSNVGKNLNDYVKEHYPDSKADMFAVFMEHCATMIKQNRFQAMITMQSWMFLSSFEKLRSKMLMTDTVNMAHLGARAFEEIGGEVVQTTSWIQRKSHVNKYKTTYCRLLEPNTQQAKEDMFLAKENRYVTLQDNFSKIPGSPIAYWASSNVLNAYQNGMSLGDAYFPRQGLAAGDVNYFYRYWTEINFEDIGLGYVDNESFLTSNKLYAPVNKGGGRRNYYGNNFEVLKFDAENYKKLLNSGNRLPSKDRYFKQGITWNKISSSYFSSRYVDIGFVFTDAGMKITSDNEIYSLGAIMSSKVFSYLISFLSETLNFEKGNISKFPIIAQIDNKKAIYFYKDNISLSKSDWDSFETSWDFTKHPLLKYGVSIYGGLGDGQVMPCSEFGIEKNEDNFKIYEKNAPKAYTIQSAFEMWQEVCEKRFNQLKANEEELNRIFIDIYGLQDELTPDVEDKDVTVRKADLQRDIKSLISYAVGCMFGRYSLDREGLVFAGGNFNDVYWQYKGQAALDENGEPIRGGYAGISLTDYHYSKFHDSDNWETATELSFEPDADNCIPITDEEYFEDDIVGLFCDWLKKVYGEDTLEENLDFIAKALGNKGSTSREIIRNYFLNDFIKDHNKIYQKRPIYWLFDSGKQNGFKALCYMHRWNADTIGHMRVEYLHRMQRVYDKEIERMQEIIDNSRDNKEINKATKRKEKLQKQVKETKDYDAKVAHLALSRIDIDLDDGVKVNYEKVQTGKDGKKMQILVKI